MRSSCPGVTWVIVGEGLFQTLLGTNALYSYGAKVSFGRHPLSSPEFSMPTRLIC